MFQRWIKNAILKKIIAFRDLDGWLSDDEAIALYRIAKKLKPNATIVEIGSWQGKSTYCLASAIKYGKIHAIDPFNADGGFDTESEKLYQEKKGGNDLLQQFSNNMDKLGVLQKITTHQGYSYQMNSLFDKIDLLFIDGDHSIKGCQSDFNLYAPKLTKGGYIAFHDFYANRDELGPTYVIKNFLLNSKDFLFYGQFDSLWIARKIS